MSNLNEVPTTANMGDFDALIEDGKMIITPADAGIQLFAYVNMTEKEIKNIEDGLKLSMVKLANVRRENEDFRELLDTVYPILMLTGHVDLAQKILRKIYPATGNWEDGTTE